MALTNEDSFRLNILLASDVQAIRIDESKMTILGLTSAGDAKVQLHPNCKDEQYLRQVRELLSAKILNHPGGYPIYIKRWTRMGQNRAFSSLKQCLLLGEPEAVVAVVYSANISADIGKLAWWILPNSENARKMLTYPQIVCSEFGKELAQFLIEFLPFENDSQIIIDTVRYVMQSDLISPHEKQKLWQKGKKKLLYRTGYLFASAHHLPEPQNAHSQLTKLLKLQTDKVFILDKSPFTALAHVLSATGQTFLYHLGMQIAKPSTQAMVSEIFSGIQHYFKALGLIYDLQGGATIENCSEQAHQFVIILYEDKLICDVLDLLDYYAMIEAIVFLSLLNERVVLPIFSKTSAEGTVMRKKLKPVIQIITQHIKILFEGKV